MREDHPSSKCSEGTQLKRSDDVPQDWIALMARDESGAVQAARIFRIADGFAWFDITADTVHHDLVRYCLHSW